MEKGTFSYALERLKVGHDMERVGWNGGGMWVDARYPNKHHKMTHPFLVMNIPGCEEGLRTLPWQPAQVDLFATDWREKVHDEEVNYE